METNGIAVKLTEGSSVSFFFEEVTEMYEEQRLMSCGVPFSEASGICQSLRRDIAMGRMKGESDPLDHVCKCGGSHNCPDCPNRNK